MIPGLKLSFENLSRLSEWLHDKSKIEIALTPMEFVWGAQGMGAVLLQRGTRHGTRAEPTIYTRYPHEPSPPLPPPLPGPKIIDIPSPSIAHVMGTKGAGLREIENDTNTFLFMARDSDNTDVPGAPAPSLGPFGCGPKMVSHAGLHVRRRRRRLGVRIQARARCVSPAHFQFACIFFLE